MSEEQNFKITDRRLFNADGSPRDVPREDVPDEVESTPVAPAAAAPAPAAENSVSTTAPPEAANVAVAAEPATTPETAGIAEDEIDPGEIPGAHDPTSFVNFLMMIASNAASSLGMMENPATGERGVDLQHAKHWIDVLGMLRSKTKGNLDPKEQKIFDDLLSDLRMQFVSLNTGTGPAPRSYTSRDITGGQ